MACNFSYNIRNILHNYKFMHKYATIKNHVCHPCIFTTNLMLIDIYFY